MIEFFYGNPDPRFPRDEIMCQLNLGGGQGDSTLKKQKREHSRTSS